MDQELDIVFLKALEQHQQKLLRVCSVSAEDAEDANYFTPQMKANLAMGHAAALR